MFLISKKRIRRVLKISAYSICFLILLLFCSIYFILPVVLKENGISYTEKNFDFPSTLKVEGLKIKRPNLIANISNFKINLSWSELLNGRVSGDYFIVENGTIEYTAIKNNKPYDSNFLKDFMPISFKEVKVSNIFFKNIDANDTLIVMVPELSIRNINLGNSWHIDSFVNTGIHVSWLQHSVAIENKKPDTSQRHFLLTDLPDYTIKYCRLIDCDLNIQTMSQHHSVKKINIELNRQKENELYAMAVNKFSLRYQDTFDIDLSLNKLLVNNHKEAHISNLAFDFPWLKLHIPQLDIYNDREISVDAIFKESYINTALVKRFFPKVKLPFNHDLPIKFDGGMTITKDKLLFNKMALSLADKTSFRLNGFANLTDSHSPDMVLDVSNLCTSINDLEKLFDFKRPANVKELDVKSSATIAGNYENITIEGVLGLNNVTTNINVLVSQRSQKHIGFSFKLNAGLFDPNQIYNMDGTLLKLSKLKIAGNADLDMNNKLSSLDIRLASDSVNTETYSYHYPSISIRYLPAEIFAEIKLNNFCKLSLHSPDNILSDHVRFNGFIESKVPQLSTLDSSAGDFFSEFKGIYSKDAVATDFKMVLETIRFKPKGFDTTYLSNGVITAGQNSDKDLHMNLTIDHKEIIRFTTTQNISNWWSRKDKWNGDFPKTNLYAAINIDSILMFQLTGQQGAFELNNMQVVANKNDLKANIDMPEFLFDKYNVKGLKGTFESVAGNLNGELTASHFQNPLTQMQNVKINATQMVNQSIKLSFNSFLPEVKNNFELNSLFSYSDSFYNFNLDDKEMRLGTYAWKNLDSKGFVLNHDFELVSGDLHIVNGRQKISMETILNTVSLKMDSLRLDPILKLFTNDSFFHGDFNLIADYDLKNNYGNWSGSFSQLQVNKKNMGGLRFEGQKSGTTLSTNIAMNEAFGKVHLLIKKEDKPLVYTLTIDGLDLTYLNAGTPWEKTYPLTGLINARLGGSYDSKLISQGYMDINNVETYLTENKIYLHIKDDTLWFKDNDIIANKFTVYDKKENMILLDGKLNLSADPDVDIAVFSKGFNILAPESKGKTIKGNLDIASDLHIRKRHDKFEINGQLDVLPNSDVSYLYESSVKIDERENEMSFVSFEKYDGYMKDTIVGVIKSKPSKPIDWNVNLSIEKLNATVLLSETYQDKIKMNASGNIQLKTGIGNLPNCYGTLKSNEGSIIYDVPMISNVDLKIENALVNWSGDVYDPRITFQGSEVFRVSPKDIPGMANASGVVPISVIVKINDRSVNNLDITFDLNSNDAKVKSWIESLPQDSRQANALNLLLFGSLNFGESESNLSLVQGLATKMNELSRRNIKSADLSFYSEKQDISGNTLTTSDRLGYSYSKGLFNNSVKVTLGGTLDLNNTSVTNQKQSTNQGSVQLDYIISESPEIIITTSQRTVYDGAINGEIGKTTVGIVFLKRFRNLFKSKSRNKQR